MAKALYRKWRPQNWEEVKAQDHVIITLRNAVANDRVAHAYLFAGPRGTGKTTTARLLAKAVNCLEPDLSKRPCEKCENCKAITSGRFMDLIEIDAASNTSVDDVRDLRDKINFSPSQGKFKVYIIDEVHMLSTAAFNALLKTLEEPPPHAIFILATTEIHKIPATVLSRCQRHEFRRIPVDMIVEHLKQKSEEEKLTLPDTVFTEIARQSTGSLRDAISLLDQLTSTTNTVTLEMAQDILGTATSMSVIEIIDALIAKDTAGGLSIINKTLDSGADPRQLARQIVTYLRNLLLVKMGNQHLIEVPEDIKEIIFNHAPQLSLPELLRALESFNKATMEEHANWHPGLGLELAITTYLVEPEMPLQPNREVESQPLDKPPAKSSPATKKAPKAKQKAAPTPRQVEEVPPSEPEIEPQLEEIEHVEVVDLTESEDQPASDIPEEPEQSEGNLTITHIHQAWEAIKSLVGKHNAKTKGLMNTCKLAGIKDNMLILGFSTTILKEMMEKEGNLNLVSDILTEYFHQPLNVRCIVTTNQDSQIPDNLEIESDGMVSAATRDLGGKISRAQEDKQ